MPNQRVICIGDVHGCLDELKELLKEANWTPSDRVILVGDLVDRGPNSAEVVKFVRFAGFECVQGNHDNKFMRYYLHEKRRKESKKPYKNPMRLNAEKRSTYESLSKTDLKWFASLPSSIFLENYGPNGTLIVHAGCKPGQHPLHQKSNIYRHCRYVYGLEKNFETATLDTTTYAQPEGTSYWAELYTHNINIIHGHHVGNTESPQVRTNELGAVVTGIDTGCCFGGKLTAVILEKNLPNSYVQVDAKEEYYKR